jgi:hypothetical protein
MDLSAMIMGRRGLSFERTLTLVLWGVTAAALLLALERILRRPWWPIFDDAAIWLRTWDVGTKYTPLIGAYSRFGWNHPGPMLFYVLAPLLRLFGGLPSALQAGALSIGVASALGLVVLASRRAGPGAALVLGIATGLLGTGYGDRLIEPWNPYVGTLPFTLFMVASWLVACGDKVSPTIAALAGTFAAQAHLGALVPFVVVGAVAWLLDRLFPAAPRASGTWKWHALALGVLLLLWTPPLIQQLVRSEGNLGRILQFSMASPEPIVGLRKGLLLSGNQLLPWGPWLGNESGVKLGHLQPAPLWALIASALPLLIALGLARRFRDALGVRLVAIAGAGFLACVLASSLVRGMAAEYLTLWSRAVAMTSTAAPFVVLARRYATEPLLRRAGAPLALAAAAALAVVPISFRARSARVSTPHLSRAYEVINPIAVASVPPGGTVRVIGTGIAFTASPHAITVALERTGRFGKMQQFHGLEVGRYRTIADDVVLPTLALVMGPDTEVPPDPALARLLGRGDPLSPERRAEAIRLRGRLDQALRQLKREDLLGPLHAAALWLGEVAPADLNRAELDRYLELAGGEDKIPWALYAQRPGPR